MNSITNNRPPKRNKRKRLLLSEETTITNTARSSSRIVYDSVGVTHDEEKRRFIVSYPGRGISYVEYILLNSKDEDDDNVVRFIDLQHTYTTPRLRGKGLAARVVRAAFEFAANNNIRVIPTCTYIPVFVTKYPEFKSVLAKDTTTTTTTSQ